MIVTDEQIEYIARNLEFYGISSEELRNDVLDHICTHIESGNFDNFEIAYKDALQKFGGYSAMSTLERDRYMLVTFKKNLRRQKLIYTLAFITAFTLLLGTLFKIMHWPYASILIFTGFILLIFGCLPLYFYQRYQTYYKKLMSQ